MIPLYMWQSNIIRAKSGILGVFWELCLKIYYYIRGVAKNKSKGVSKSHDHGHMVYKNSGVMDTLYYNSLYLL